MANFQLYSNKVWTLPLKAINLATNVTQAIPAGSAVAAASSNSASLGAVIALAGSATNLVLTPKVQSSAGLSVTITGLSLAPVTFVVDIVPDPNQLALVVDTTPADITTTPQNVPTAPGP